MLDIYLIILFLLVSSVVYIYVQREHLTSPPSSQIEKRIVKLEDEYKQLHNTVTTQEKRMGEASSQAADAKAKLDLART